MVGYHTLTPFRIYKNQTGRIMRAIKYGRRTAAHDLRPVLYIQDHNGTLSNEEMEAVVRACDSAVDEALGRIGAGEQAAAFTAADI